MATKKKLKKPVKKAARKTAKKPIVKKSNRAMKKVRVKAAKKNVKTIVNFVLDCSGSMGSLRDSVISSFNEYINSLKKQKGEFLFSLTPFSTTVMERTYDMEDIKKVKEMKEFKTYDMTALYDGIGNALRYAEEKVEKMKQTPAVLFVILTDGYENASREFTLDAVKKLIDEKTKDGNYSFIFLGANKDSWITGKNMGINVQNTATFTPTAQGMQKTMRAISMATVSLSCVANAGAGGGASEASKFRAFKGTKNNIDDLVETGK